MKIKMVVPDEMTQTTLSSIVCYMCPTCDIYHMINDSDKSFQETVTMLICNSIPYVAMTRDTSKKSSRREIEENIKMLEFIVEQNKEILKERYGK